jgi:hypothetical protein
VSLSTFKLAKVDPCPPPKMARARERTSATDAPHHRQAGENICVDAACHTNHHKLEAFVTMSGNETFYLRY